MMEKIYEKYKFPNRILNLDELLSVFGLLFGDFFDCLKFPDNGLTVGPRKFIY